MSPFLLYAWMQFSCNSLQSWGNLGTKARNKGYSGQKHPRIWDCAEAALPHIRGGHYLLNLRIKLGTTFTNQYPSLIGSSLYSDLIAVNNRNIPLDKKQVGINNFGRVVESL